MACELGFISPADCDGLVADAARSNEAGIASTLERVNRLRSASTFHRTHRLDQDAEDELRAPAADPERFAKVARRLHLQFHVNRPTWTWQVESIHDAVLRGASPAQLHWLAGAVRRTSTTGCDIHRQVRCLGAAEPGITTFRRAARSPP